MRYAGDGVGLEDLVGPGVVVRLGDLAREARRLARALDRT